MQALPLIDLGGVWMTTFFIAISLTIVFASAQWDHLLPRSVMFLALYVAIEALFVLEWPAMHFGPYTPNYQATAGQVLVELFFVPIGAWLFRDQIEKYLAYPALFACLCTWMGRPGLLNAPSFNSAFAAAALPFIPWQAALIVIVTVVSHHGSTALMILGAQMFALAIRNNDRFSWVTFSMVSVVAAFFAYRHSGVMFDGGERLEKYCEFFRFWAKEPRWIIAGVGPGSFIWTSLMIDNFKPHHLFMQMHSDWLQILWEEGLAGLGLTLWVVIAAVKRAWNDTNCLAGIFGIVAFALTYHPIRFYPTALLTAFIFLRAFSCKGDSRPTHP